MKTKILLLMSLSLVFNIVVEASSQQQSPAQETPNKTSDKRLEYEKIVQEYKDYLAQISVEVRQEIVAYRKEISRLNLEKTNLFDKLSQKAQEYLKKERDFKQRLPIDTKPTNPISDSVAGTANDPSMTTVQDQNASKK
ncbi:MAG: hypothetical protein H6909_04005 [Rickettsiaceae bacterium]|nr:hypothetical protein [Rickettsiaceae bacterium]